MTDYGTPPADCRDPHWWEVEQANARTLARRPELALEAGERYAGRVHAGYDFPIDVSRANDLRANGRLCARCDGHGWFNLRRSVLCGWHWAICWSCEGYGRVPVEVDR